MRVRFIHGRRYPFKCKFCDATRQGIVYRELVEWRAKMSCGHHRHLGYTMPLEVLNDLGLVNEHIEKEETFDEALADEMEKMKQISEWKQRVAKNSTRGSLLH